VVAIGQGGPARGLCQFQLVKNKWSQAAKAKGGKKKKKKSRSHLALCYRSIGRGRGACMASHCLLRMDNAPSRACLCFFRIEPMSYNSEQLRIRSEHDGLHGCIALLNWEKKKRREESVEHGLAVRDALFWIQPLFSRGSDHGVLSLFVCVCLLWMRKEGSNEQEESFIHPSLSLSLALVNSFALLFLFCSIDHHCHHPFTHHCGRDLEPSFFSHLIPILYFFPPSHLLPFTPTVPLLPFFVLAIVILAPIFSFWLSFLTPTLTWLTNFLDFDSPVATNSTHSSFLTCSHCYQYSCRSNPTNKEQTGYKKSNININQP
jgi:hypothetical protein